MEKAIMERDFGAFASITMQVNGLPLILLMTLLMILLMTLLMMFVTALNYLQDSNQFHAVCLDTDPPIFYLNDISKRIIQLITRYNSLDGHIKVCAVIRWGACDVLAVIRWGACDQVGCM